MDILHNYCISGISDRARKNNFSAFPAELEKNLEVVFPISAVQISNIWQNEKQTIDQTIQIVMLLPIRRGHKS